MIYFLDGTLAHCFENFLILEVNGIGYQVHIPTTTTQSLPSVGSSIKVFTYHHIREDTQQLFGFLTVEDRDFFIQLTSVNGVGPKVGLKILSTIATPDMIQAIIREDLAVLTSVSGVGKKMAEKIILDLRDKLPKLYATNLDSSIAPSKLNASTEMEADFTLALKSLGYKADEIRTALRQSSHLISDNSSLEDGIKIILKHL